MERMDSNRYLSIKDSALLLLNFLNINPRVDNNLDKMYRRILRLIHHGDIPFKKASERYFLNKEDIELLRVKIKEEIEILNPFLGNQTPRSRIESPVQSSVQNSVESLIEKIENIIKLQNDKSISSKQALTIINTIIKNYNKA